MASRHRREESLKNTGVCPKCNSTEIRVLRKRTQGTMIPLRATLFGMFFSSSWEATAFGAAAYSSWFICVTCGFVETWIERNEDLERIRKKLEAR
jgi:hypothetical protein